MKNLQHLSFLMFLGFLLCSCSTFGNKNKLKDDQILPSYAAPANNPLPVESAILSNNMQNYLATSQISLESAFALTLASFTDTMVSAKLPVLFGQIDYAHDRQIYPLLYSDLDWVIPENNVGEILVNQNINELHVEFYPSSYNRQTLQLDNLESALHTNALLANRAFFINHIDEKQKIAIRGSYLRMAKSPLKVLYDKNPELKNEFESAVAFGVFEIYNYNVLLYVGGYGKGVIFDNKNKKVIYMYTTRAGTGPGVGYESLYVVFVFKKQFALEQFIGAKGGGADIGASITLGILGGQISFDPEISVYQIYKSGFDLQANWGGTLYMPAINLNN